MPRNHAKIRKILINVILSRCSAFLELRDREAFALAGCTMQEKVAAMMLVTVMAAALPGAYTPGTPGVGLPIPVNHLLKSPDSPETRKSGRKRQAPKHLRENKHENANIRKRGQDREDPTTNKKRKSKKAKINNAERQIGDEHPDIDGSIWLGRRWSCKHQRQKSHCKECGGGGICEHNKRKSRCKEFSL